MKRPVFINPRPSLRTSLIAGLWATCLACANSSTEPQTAPPPGAEPVAAQPEAPNAEPTGGPERAPTAQGSVITASFFSDALGVQKQYYVYLPAGYEESKRPYPVVYMLHGLGGDESNWVERVHLNRAADTLGLQAIVVMPDGDDAFYVNWASEADYDGCLKGRRPFGAASDMATYCVRRARYEDYIVNDLVRHVESTYRAMPERRARAIGGLSMGGYGALVLAMRHPDVFASVASHSGVDALLYVGPFPYEKGKQELAEDPVKWLDSAGFFGAHFKKIFGTDIANWRAHDPAYMAASLTDGRLAIYLDCGTEDRLRLNNGAAYLHDVLEAKHVSHFFELLPGDHNAAFWQERIDDSLRFHAAQFAAAGIE